MNLLNMEDEVLMTSKTSLAAQNRFVYYPDHLVRMPGPGVSPWAVLRMLATEPMFKGTLRSILTPRAQLEPWPEDESVASFISKLVGAGVVDNIVSAVLHGIYAGDVYQLSVKSIMPRAWVISRMDIKTLANFILARGKLINLRDSYLMGHLMSSPKAGNETWDSEMFGMLANSSVFSFKGGIGRLAERLEEELRALPNVTIRTATPINCIQHVKSNGQSQVFDHRAHPRFPR